MIIPSLPKKHSRLLIGNIVAHVLHAVKPPQSSHHGNHGKEVSCYRDGKRLGRLSATVLCAYIYVCASVCLLYVDGGWS